MRLSYLPSERDPSQVNMDTANKLTNFLRCENSIGVPESLCTVCLHTLVAPNLEALEQAELKHDCRGEVRRKRTW
jgi:hypothetical protein